MKEKEININLLNQVSICGTIPVGERHSALHMKLPVVWDEHDLMFINRCHHLYSIIRYLEAPGMYLVTAYWYTDSNSTHGWCWLWCMRLNRVLMNVDRNSSNPSVCLRFVYWGKSSVIELDNYQHNAAIYVLNSFHLLDENEWILEILVRIRAVTMSFGWCRFTNVQDVEPVCTFSLTDPGAMLNDVSFCVCLLCIRLQVTLLRAYFYYNCVRIKQVFCTIVTLSTIIEYSLHNFYSLRCHWLLFVQVASIQVHV